MALNGVEREGVCSFTLLVINYDGSKVASSALLTTRNPQIKSISGSSSSFLIDLIKNPVCFFALQVVQKIMNQKMSLIKVLLVI